MDFLLIYFILLKDISAWIFDMDEQIKSWHGLLSALMTGNAVVTAQFTCGGSAIHCELGAGIAATKSPVKVSSFSHASQLFSSSHLLFTES